MADKQLLLAVASSAAAQLRDLQPAFSGLKTWTEAKAYRTNTDGWDVECGIFRADRRELVFSLFLDRYLGGKQRQFWYGMAINRQSPWLRAALSRLPPRLQPIETFTRRNMETASNGLLRFKGDFPDTFYSRVVAELHSDYLYIGSYLPENESSHRRVSAIAARPTSLWQAFLTATDKEVLIEEGAPAETVIVSRSRSFKLRREALKAFGGSNGRLQCSACTFSTPRQVREVVELHHKKPIHLFTLRDQVNSIQKALKRLMPLCPTCHRLAHTQTPPLSLASLKKLRGPDARLANAR